MPSAPRRPAANDAAHPERPADRGCELVLLGARRASVPVAATPRPRPGPSAGQCGRRRRRNEDGETRRAEGRTQRPVPVFSPDADACRDRVGLQIVQALVEQLSGTIQWENGRGTSAKIIFPIMN